ncbi:MAG TPA: glycosyltransferase family 87 protein [Caulobacteraceae bacterium]|nr:glycosyltransferase family 87 protein [Caulobacteraceae bacterium]
MPSDDATPMILGPKSRAEKRLVMVSLGIAAGYLVALAAMFARHSWVLGADRRPIMTDFAAMWSAGSLARDGHALSAYDGRLQHAAEVATVGHQYQGYFGWNYPPSFLLVMVVLAGLPYAVAFVAWVASTLALYVVSIAALSRRWATLLAALAAPWMLACAFTGQNGFLAAALIGLVLLTMDERPILSGILLGFLAFKPQFGFLFPFVLVASGRWRVLAWATVSTVSLTGLSIVVFGPDVFLAFLHNLALATGGMLNDGQIPWYKLQSIYSMSRALGAPNSVGWCAQGAAAAACATMVVWLWRGGAPTALKAASLPVAAILATPYVFNYDLPILGVTMVLLYRQRSFDRLEYVVLGVAALVINAGFPIGLPLGLIAPLAFGAVVGRRVVALQRGGSSLMSPSPIGARPSLAPPLIAP